MSLQKLIYNSNDQEHVGFADTLGLLQNGIVKGIYTQQTMHAYYAGHELPRDEINPRFNGYFLKKDAPGSGRTKTGRSQNRIIVPVWRSGSLVEGFAWAWRHDNRMLRLDEGFFTRGKQWRI